MLPPYFLQEISKYVLPNMQKQIFEILVQTALVEGQFCTILKLTPKFELLSCRVDTTVMPKKCSGAGTGGATGPPNIWLTS